MTVQSTIAWLDFSEKDRRVMMEAVSLFSIRDTRDELGLGSIRDAFADLFFPGTSTLQTRARYFLFVPWLYLDYERRQVSSNRIASILSSNRNWQLQDSHLVWISVEQFTPQNLIGPLDFFCHYTKVIWDFDASIR